MVLSYLYCIIAGNFKDDLDKEYKLLVVCQTIFAVSFFIRVVLITLVSAHKWIDYTRDYFVPDQNYGKGYWVMFPMQFVIYNFIPYMTIICFHWYNSKQHSLENDNMSQADRELERGAEEENSYMRLS